MTLSVRTRFEVFKRDRFTCSYCGRNRDTGAVLEVDHVVPLAAGGTDDLANLATSCWDCNHGKAAELLDEGAGPAVDPAAVAALAARVERQRGYAELVAEDDRQLSSAMSDINRRWCKAFGGWESDGMLNLHSGRFPDQASVRAILRRLPVHIALDKVDVTASKFEDPSLSACRYFYGCCWRSIKDGDQPPCARCSELERRLEESERMWEREFGYSTGYRDAGERLEAVVSVLAIRLSEITGGTDADITAWAESEVAP